MIATVSRLSNVERADASIPFVQKFHCWGSVRVHYIPLTEKSRFEVPRVQKKFAVAKKTEMAKSDVRERRGD
jgi:hypothetical protein